MQKTKKKLALMMVLALVVSMMSSGALASDMSGFYEQGDTYSGDYSSGDGAGLTASDEAALADYGDDVVTKLGPEKIAIGVRLYDAPQLIDEHSAQEQGINDELLAARESGSDVVYSSINFDDFWIAGTGGNQSIRGFICPAPGCRHTVHSSFSLLFHPLPLPPGTQRQLAHIIVTCASCGAVSMWRNTSNNGASLARPGANPQASNNIGMGGAELLFTIQSPEITDPTIPGSPYPETNNPETTDPEATDPETTDPETTNPETTNPETTDPETTNPETTNPETTDPETTDPETNDPETTNPETPDSENTEPENPNSGNPNPNNPNPNNPNPNNPNPNNPNPNSPNPNNPNPNNPNPNNPNPSNPNPSNPNPVSPNPDNPNSGNPSGSNTENQSPDDVAATPPAVAPQPVAPPAPQTETPQTGSLEYQEYIIEDEYEYFPLAAYDDAEAPQTDAGESEYEGASVNDGATLDIVDAHERFSDDIEDEQGALIVHEVGEEDYDDLIIMEEEIPLSRVPTVDAGNRWRVIIAGIVLSVAALLVTIGLIRKQRSMR